MYGMMFTRPDIIFAVWLVSRYQSNPGLVHWTVVKKMLWYLYAIIDYMLCFQGADLVL